MSAAPSPRRGTAAIAIAGALTLIGAGLLLQAWRERAFPVAAVSGEALLVTSARAIDRMALSFDAVAADLYWIRTIQHYGGTKRSAHADKRYPLLRPLLDLTTGLDPRFVVPYRFGAIFLAESPPDGPGRPDWSLALLEKGLRALPDRWQFAMDAGFVHYWWRHDYRAAAAWFERAAAMPGGPWWLRSLAATTLAEGGDRASSRRMWRQIYDTADSEWLRSTAGQRLRQLDAVDQMDVLTAVVRRWSSARGQLPQSWQDMVRAGWLRGIPVDPAGAPYDLVPSPEYPVRLNVRSPLSPLPPQLTQKASPSS